jgi:hypothetical protein
MSVGREVLLHWTCCLEVRYRRVPSTRLVWSRGRQHRASSADEAVEVAGDHGHNRIILATQVRYLVSAGELTTNETSRSKSERWEVTNLVAVNERPDLTL